MTAPEDRAAGRLLQYDKYGLPQSLLQGAGSVALRDVFRERHPTHTGFTHGTESSEARIDMFLADPLLARLGTLRVGVAKGSDCWSGSDHRPVILGLAWRRVFGEAKRERAREPRHIWQGMLKSDNLKGELELALEQHGDLAAQLRKELDELAALEEGRHVLQLRERMDSAGAAFLSLTRALLETAWGNRPKAGKKGRSLESCNRWRALKHARRWTARCQGNVYEGPASITEQLRVSLVAAGVTVPSALSKQWVDKTSLFLLAERAREQREAVQGHVERGNMEYEAAVHGEKGLAAYIHKVTGRPRHRLVLDEVLVNEESQQWSTDEEKIGEVAAAHFQAHWGRPKPLPQQLEYVTKPDGRRSVQVREGVEDFVQELYGRQKANLPAEGDLEELAMSDLRELLGQARTGSAAGDSGVSYEALAELPEETFKDMLALLNHILRLRVIPTVFKLGVVVPIPKSNSGVTLANCRPLSLLEHVYKLVSAVLAQRLKWKLVDAGVLERNQHGFVPALGTITCSAELLSAIETVLTGTGEELWCCSLDCAAAFDRVPHWSLEISYRRMGLSEELIDLLREMEVGGVSRVRLGWGLSPEVSIQTGVRQGCPLSPIVFVIWMDAWLTWSAA